MLTRKNLCLLPVFIYMGLLFSCSSNKSHEETTQPVAQEKSGISYIKVYTTAKDTNLRISPTDSLIPKAELEPDQTEMCIFLDVSRKYQELIGIGGALTDAAAETFAKLPEQQQQEVIRAYYDTINGIGYTLGRTNIHSCDFSSSSYTYIQDGDTALQSFSVEHDKQYRIPLIKKVLEATHGKYTLFASPWSPPAWMKDNNNMLHGGKLKKEYRHAWAMYYTKFIKSYAQEGIPIWGITVQNEPMAEQTWESCIFTAEEERDFLKNYLGPVMWKEGLKEKKIIVWDHNRDFMYHRADVIFNDSAAAKYAWGIGFHWYEDWNGGKELYNNVKFVREAFPDKHLLFTEGCIYPFKEEHLGEWKWGEKYGEALINDLNNGSVGWTDWNVLLDETGGPNHVGNLLFSPIHANIKTGKLFYMNSYYYIGHFSKYIRPGARRITSVSSHSSLLCTSFINRDGKIIAVVMNVSDKMALYHFYVNDKRVKVSCPAHGIQTLVLNSI